MIERFVRRSDRPSLHALVHRYDIPRGTTTGEQTAARIELVTALREAYEAGRSDERARLRPQLESFLARIDAVLSVTDDTGGA